MGRQRLVDQDGSRADSAACLHIHIRVANQPGAREVTQGEGFSSAQQKAGLGLAAVTWPRQLRDYTSRVVVAVEDEIERQIGAGKLGQHRAIYCS